MAEMLEQNGLQRRACNHKPYVITCGLPQFKGKSLHADVTGERRTNLSPRWRARCSKNQVNLNILQERVVSRLLTEAAVVCRRSLRDFVEGRCGERRAARCHGHRCGIKSLCMFIAFARAGGGALECD